LCGHRQAITIKFVLIAFCKAKKEAGNAKYICSKFHRRPRFVYNIERIFPIFKAKFPA